MERTEGKPCDVAPPSQRGPPPEKTVQALSYRISMGTRNLRKLVASHRSDWYPSDQPDLGGSMSSFLLQHFAEERSSLFPWSGIIMPSSMVSHMEIEPECHAPCTLPLESVSGVWGCQHFHVDHHTCLIFNRKTNFERLQSHPVWNRKRANFHPQTV